MNILATEKSLKEFEELFQQILSLSKTGCYIIVEGKKDVLSLMKLNVNGRFITIGRGVNQVFRVNLSCKGKAIVLTDFDEKGESLASETEKTLEELGVTIVRDLRKRLRQLISSSDLPKVVEGFSTWYLNKTKRVRGEEN